MQAVIYTEYGPPEVLHMAERPCPAPGDNELQIGVRATPVNFGDLMARNFGNVTRREFNMPYPLLPLSRLQFGWRAPKNQILGSEFAGVVEAAGKNVTRFEVGDPVFGYRGPSFGAYAERLCVAEEGMVARKPDNVNFAEAAASSYGPLTALNLLRKAEIRPGDKVLINGASGSIGAAALQLAKHAGAEVTGVCGAKRVAMVEALGADAVIDYSREDFTRNGVRYDLIFDVLGKTSYSQVKDSLAPAGRYQLASFKSPHLWQMLRTSLFGKQKVICALSMEKPADLEQVRALLAEGAVKTVVDRCFPLEAAAEAHTYAESGLRTGSVILTVGGYQCGQ